MVTLFKHVRRLCVHIVRNVKFLTDNGLYSVRAEHGYKRMHAIHIAVVGYRNGVHPSCFESVAKRVRLYSLFGIGRIGRDLQKSNRAVQKAVFGV